MVLHVKVKPMTQEKDKLGVRKKRNNLFHKKMTKLLSVNNNNNKNMKNVYKFLKHHIKIKLEDSY